MRNDLQGQMIKYIAAINQYFPEGTKLAIPKGGLSISLNSLRVLMHLIFRKKHSIKELAFVPVISFSSMEYYQNYIRLNYCPLWTNKVESAIKNLALIVNSY